MTRNPMLSGTVSARRTLLLCGVATAVLIGTAGPSQAADTLQFLGTESSSGTTNAMTVTPNNGLITAIIGPSDIAITVATPQSLLNNYINSQILIANAGANIINHNLTPVITLGDDIASLAVEENTNVILATADDIDFTIDIDEAPTGTASIDANRIAANTVVNLSNTVIAPTLAAGASSTDVGDTFFWDIGTPGGGWYEADATLAGLTIQQNDQGGRGQARALDGSLTITVDNEGSGALQTAPLEIDGNDVQANYTGNQESTAITVTDGGSPTFTGSAAAMSYQFNGALAHANNIEAQVSNQIVRAQVMSNTAATLDPAFAGVLSVSGNGITSSGTGNSADNSILLAGSVSLDGNNVIRDNDAYFQPGNILIDVEADLVVHTVQQNVAGGILETSTDEVLIQGLVESSDGGNLDVSDNEISSTARGNVASSEISNGGPATTIAGSSAIMNFQNNAAGQFPNEVNAATVDTDILATIGNGAGVDDLFNETVINLSGNRVLSSALGNSASQLLDLDANALDIGLTAAALELDLTGLFGGPELLSDGGATISNVQLNQTSPVTARTINSTISVTTDLGGGDVTNSTIDVSENVQEAAAGGSSANSELNLSGNTVQVGAGINSAQLNDVGSPITATLEADPSIVIPTDVVVVLPDPDSVYFKIHDNLQDTLAFGNNVQNSLSVDSNLTVAAAAAGAGDVGSSIDTALTTTSANYAVQSVQGQYSTVTATTGSLASLLEIEIGGEVTDSRLGIDDNMVGAAAFGNDAANLVDLIVNSLTVAGDDYGNLAAISNAQYLNNDVSALIEPDENAILITIDGHVDPSAITASGNTLEALAVGNRTTENDLAVTGNIVVSESDGTPRGLIDNSAPIVADAALVVQNVQLDEDGGVVARIVSGNTVPDILIDLGDELDDSSVAADENVLTARATNQSGASALTVDGVNQLQATAAIQNYQESDGGAIATAGVRGSGITIEVGTLTTNAIDNSALSISENERSAAAIGNDGTTVLDVTANMISAAGGNSSANATNNVATADFVLGSTQDATGSIITGSAFATLVIDVFDTDETDVGTTGIDINDNLQSAVGVGNTGDNSLSILGTNILDSDDFSVNSALLSVQRGGTVIIGATSDLIIQAPVEAAVSNVELSRNQNTALAVINDVTNSSSIAAANIAGQNDATASANLITGPVETTVNSDHVLNNIQTAGGTLMGSASTSISNLDAGDAGTLTSTILVKGNVTATEASANRASNALSIDGTAANHASAGLANYQSSSTVVNSTATTTVGLSIAGLNADAFEDSTASTSGNITTALGRGNAASNVLNYAGGQMSPASPVVASSSLSGAGALTGTANAEILNAQNNSGPVTVSATMAVSYALNGLGGNSAAINSTATISGNVVNAVGYGNFASNSLTVSGTNNGASAGVTSHQVNSGNVIVTASAPMSITIGTGSVSNSTFGISGNAVTATAVGNSVSTVITN